MSVIIIGGGGAHNSITRLTVAGVCNRMTPEQIARFEALVDQLQALAHEVDPQ